MKPKLKFYQPGPISLLILPIICAIYIYHDAFTVKYYLTPVNWSYDISRDDTISMHYIQPLQVPHREFYEIALDGTIAQNNLTIKKFDSLTNNLSKLNDTLTGVKIRFSTNTSFENMVDAIDVCNRIAGDHFGYVIKNDVLFAYNNTKTQLNYINNSKPLLFNCLSNDHVLVKSGAQLSPLKSILNVPDDLSGYGIKAPVICVVCIIWMYLFLNMFIDVLKQIWRFLANYLSFLQT